MYFPKAEIIRALEDCPAVFAPLSSAESSALFQQWTACYGDFYTPHRRLLRGGRAQTHAQELNPGSFLLVPCRDPSRAAWAPIGTAFRCRGDRLPDLTAVSHFADVFLSPEDLAWTLLYGHEVDHFGGPHFTSREWSVPPAPERSWKLL